MQLSVGQCVSLACLLEASTPKPGNVHRGADFDDLTFFDFQVSSIAIGPAFERTEELGLGQLILMAIQANSSWVGTNTNLGMVLLLAPLAKASFEYSKSDEVVSPGTRMSQLAAGLPALLEGVSEQDGLDLFEAIRISSPGGLGEVDTLDANHSLEAIRRSWKVESANGPASQNSLFMHAMDLASHRDTIALQYCNGFQQVFDVVIPALRNALQRCHSLSDSIVDAFLETLSVIPDTLIARKCGGDVADSVCKMAAEIRKINDRQGQQAAVADLDFWLRSDGHRRNPGTTADLIAAGLFVLIRTGEWSNGIIRRALEAGRFATQTD